MYEGLYLEDKQHGRWVVRDAWVVREGSKMGGKAHGHWVFRYTNGDVLKGRFVDGTPHGLWILELADGGVGKAIIVNGEEPTNWTVEYADGVMGKCSFSFLFGRAFGEMFRQCIFIDTNGDMWMGTKGGPRVAQKPDGTGVPFMLMDSHQILRYVVDGDARETCLENNARIVDCRSLHPTIRP